MTTPTDPPNVSAQAKAKAACQLTEPQADLMSCIFGALLACLPAFLAAFMDCLGNSGNGGTVEYKPGDRQRCP